MSSLKKLVTLALLPKAYGQAIQNIVPTFELIEGYSYDGSGLFEPYTVSNAPFPNVEATTFDVLDMKGSVVGSGVLAITLSDQELGTLFGLPDQSYQLINFTAGYTAAYNVPPSNTTNLTLAMSKSCNLRVKKSSLGASDLHNVTTFCKYYSVLNATGLTSQDTSCIESFIENKYQRYCSREPYAPDRNELIAMSVIFSIEISAASLLPLYILGSEQNRNTEDFRLAGNILFALTQGFIQFYKRSYTLYGFVFSAADFTKILTGVLPQVMGDRGLKIWLPMITISAVEFALTTASLVASSSRYQRRLHQHRHASNLLLASNTFRILFDAIAAGLGAFTTTAILIDNEVISKDKPFLITFSGSIVGTIAFIKVLLDRGFFKVFERGGRNNCHYQTTWFNFINAILTASTLSSFCSSILGLNIPPQFDPSLQIVNIFAIYAMCVFFELIKIRHRPFDIFTDTVTALLGSWTFYKYTASELAMINESIMEIQSITEQGGNIYIRAATGIFTAATIMHVLRSKGSNRYSRMLVDYAKVNEDVACRHSLLQILQELWHDQASGGMYWRYLIRRLNQSNTTPFITSRIDFQQSISESYSIAPLMTACFFAVCILGSNLYINIILATNYLNQTIIDDTFEYNCTEKITNAVNYNIALIGDRVFASLFITGILTGIAMTAYLKMKPQAMSIYRLKYLLASKVLKEQSDSIRIIKANLIEMKRNYLKYGFKSKSELQAYELDPNHSRLSKYCYKCTHRSKDNIEKSALTAQEQLLNRLSEGLQIARDRLRYSLVNYKHAQQVQRYQKGFLRAQILLAHAKQFFDSRLPMPMPMPMPMPTQSTGRRRLHNSIYERPEEDPAQEIDEQLLNDLQTKSRAHLAAVLPLALTAVFLLAMIFKTQNDIKSYVGNFENCSNLGPSESSLYGSLGVLCASSLLAILMCLRFSFVTSKHHFYLADNSEHSACTYWRSIIFTRANNRQASSRMLLSVMDSSNNRNVPGEAIEAERPLI